MSGVYPYLRLKTGVIVFSPERATRTKPRPTAWVSRTPLVYPGSLERAKYLLRTAWNTGIGDGGVVSITPFQGLHIADLLSPRPMAWAGIGRPFGVKTV